MSSVKAKIKGLASLRLSQLEDKSVKEIWVLNQTNPKGEIILEVKARGDNDSTVVKIPMTWVPVCLTDQVPKPMLIESPKFRSLVSNQHIRVVDPKSLDEIMVDPDVAEEIEAVRSKNNGNYVEVLPDAVKAESISVFVLDLLSREETNSITEAEAKDILNNKEDELSDEDLEHLIKSSKSAKIKKWASDALADRESSSEK